MSGVPSSIGETGIQLIKGIRAIARQLLNKALRSRGYELRVAGMPPRGFDNFLNYARSVGFNPSTVFDIGVGHGTPWLYAGFPSSHFVLIEALPRFRDGVEKIARTLGGEAYNVALGREQGEADIRIPDYGATGASLLPRASELTALRQSRGQLGHDTFEKVKVTTLDRIANHRPPYFLKLDVEGAERDVLLGGRSAVAKTEVVLMELSILPRHDGEASFADMIALMNDLGFRIFDIVDLSQDRVNGPLVYVDVAFVRNDFSVPHESHSN